jgi:hypothetical protein
VENTASNQSLFGLKQAGVSDSVATVTALPLPLLVMDMTLPLQQANTIAVPLDPPAVLSDTAISLGAEHWEEVAMALGAAPPALMATMAVAPLLHAA